jgi:sugar lactone lactonase YvrE
MVDHLGRQSITGAAFLKDIVFGNGIVEVDIAADERTRSYPGILFRVQDPSNYERVYIRPHRSPYYDDALQYAPSFNGVDSWQLYSGPGKSSSLEILPGKWNRLKIVVSGDRADVWWNDEEKPAMQVEKLAHGISKGSLGLSDPLTGAAYYSNFSFRATDTLTLPVLAPHEPVCGILGNWELSGTYPLLSADFNRYPTGDQISGNSWQKVSADETGLVDISRHYPRNSRAGDCILARTTISTERDTLMRFGFGYSDYITVYLNKKPVFSGNSAYRSRDLSFLGIVGYFDILFLPLTRGDNELLVQVGESMGGWGFCFRREDEVFLHPAVTEQWTLKGEVAMPEAIVFNPEEKVCYVSNCFAGGREFLSKISLSGEVIVAKWVEGLRAPTGMCFQDDTLYVIDRSGVNVIDTRAGKITRKIPLTGLKMANDIAIDREGSLYISDFQGNTVFRYAGGKLEPWPGAELFENPNGLLADGDKLLVGMNDRVVLVEIPSKKISALVQLETGSNIDGVQSDGRGNYLVSDYHGKLYRITPDGGKTLLIDTSTPGDYIADFVFIPSENLFVIPTYVGNSVRGYNIK